MKNKIQSVIMFLFIIMVSAVYAETEIKELLKSEVWQERDKAISIISKNLDDYRQDQLLVNNILQLLADENDRLSELIEKNTFDSAEGRGEYYTNLLDLVIRLNIPTSTGNLGDIVSEMDKCIG